MTIVEEILNEKGTRSNSPMICAKSYGGCGYLGRPFTYNPKGLDICPKCKMPVGFMLTDDNFERLTRGLTEKEKKRARKKLDEANAKITAPLFLADCVESGWISRDRLTKQQRKILGYKR